MERIEAREDALGGSELVGDGEQEPAQKQGDHSDTEHQKFLPIR
jgi:hypothetical protein